MSLVATRKTILGSVKGPVTGLQGELVTCLSIHKIIISTGYEHHQLYYAYFTAILAIGLVSKGLLGVISALSKLSERM